MSTACIVEPLDLSNPDQFEDESEAEQSMFPTGKNHSGRSCGMEVVYIEMPNGGVVQTTIPIACNNFDTYMGYPDPTGKNVNGPINEKINTEYEIQISIQEK
jgi:hypothetical protein